MLCLAINKMNCKCNWLEIFQHAKWVVIVQCQTLWISIEETFSCMYSNGRRLNQSKQLFNFTMLRCNLPAVWSIQLMHHHFQIFFRKNSFKNQLQVMRHCWANNTDLSLFTHTLTLWFGSITQNLYRALFGSIHNTKTKFERISCRYKFYEYSLNYSNSLRNTRPTNARERESRT